jgi:hypothetical protein
MPCTVQWLDHGRCSRSCLTPPRTRHFVVTGTARLVRQSPTSTRRLVGDRPRYSVRNGSATVCADHVVGEGRELGEGAGVSRRTAAGLGWSLFALSVLLLALAFVLNLGRPQYADVGVTTGEVVALAALVLFGWFGALIVSRRPGHPIGWLLCAFGAFSGRLRRRVRRPRPDRPRGRPGGHGHGLAQLLGASRPPRPVHGPATAVPDRTAAFASLGPPPSRSSSASIAPRGRAPADQVAAVRGRHGRPRVPRLVAVLVALGIASEALVDAAFAALIACVPDASTTPSGRSRNSALACAMRSTWTPSRPSCSWWSTRRCSRPRRRCGFGNRRRRHDLAAVA